jgi:hypothetical protein
MAYPNFATDTKGSKQQPIEDLVVDVWPNGSARGRSYFTVAGSIGAEARRSLRCRSRDAQGVLRREQAAAFDFVSPWDGVTYHNVGFVVPPDYERAPRPLLEREGQTPEFF